jgi:hypothetical protein
MTMQAALLMCNAKKFEENFTHIYQEDQMELCAKSHAQMFSLILYEEVALCMYIGICTRSFLKFPKKWLLLIL